MSEAAERFAKDFVEALPEGMAREISSFNFQMGYAIGQALEKMPSAAERHVHYHVPNGAVLSAAGDVIQIKPWFPDDAVTNGVTVRGGPLDGAVINCAPDPSGYYRYVERVEPEGQGFIGYKMWRYYRHADENGYFWKAVFSNWIVGVDGKTADSSGLSTAEIIG